MRVAGCFLEYNGKFVILLRHSHKPAGNTWGLPGGKVEPGETDADAMIRELEEETGYKANAAELEHLGDYPFASADDAKPLVYITYHLKLSNPHDVRLEAAAHAAYTWVTPKECDAMPDLIPGFPELLRIVGYIHP